MATIITETLIALDIDLLDKSAVINEIASLLYANARISNQEKFKAAIFDREGVMPTGIGDLIAIPHARSAEVLTASLVYLRLKSSVVWNADQDARYIFGIAVPEDNIDNIHLKIISSVARKLIADDVKQILIASNSKREIMETLLD